MILKVVRATSSKKSLTEDKETTLTIHSLALHVIVTGILREKVVEVSPWIFLASDFIDIIDMVPVYCKLRISFLKEGSILPKSVKTDWVDGVLGEARCESAKHLC